MKIAELASRSLLSSFNRVKPAGLCRSRTFLPKRYIFTSNLWRTFDTGRKENADLPKRQKFYPGRVKKDNSYITMDQLKDFKTPVERHKLFFQYITTPTADTPGTALVLHFDNKRYLFGRISEGTQRACTERGVPLKKLRNLFLSGETGWASNGGLLGMILTIADVTSTADAEEKRLLGKISIHGGPKLWHTIACARRFIFRTGMPLKVLEASPKAWKVSETPDFYDENVLLWAIPVLKSNLSSLGDFSDADIEEDQKLRERTVHNMFDSDWRKDKLTEAIFSEVRLPATIWVRDPASKDLQMTFCHKMSDAPHIAPDQKVFVRMPWPAALVSELPSAKNVPAAVSMSYLVKGRPQRGVFNAQKAKAAGVQPGPIYKTLASGQSITLENGKVVKPEDVLDEALPGYGMAVLDIPHVHYLSDLLQKLNALKDAQVLVDFHAFLYILGPGVNASSEFAKFTSCFPEVRHVISSPDDSPNHLSMDSSAASMSRLSHIRPETFSVPKHVNEAAQVRSYDDNFLQAQRGLKLDIAPAFAVKSEEVPTNLDIASTIAGMSQDTKDLIPPVGTAASRTEDKYSDVSIATLGTGSAVPSKYRNVSANLVHIPELGYFVLDCGENTLGQLKRLHSEQELEDVLCNLHLVWISHLHADHHLGTVSLLLARKEAVRKRAEQGRPIKHNLYLISERNMGDYLEDYKSVEASDAVMLQCINGNLKDLKDNPVGLEDTTLPVTKLDSTRVSHCHGAQAVSITFSNGFKVSYSGDCRPSGNFAKIGRDSDVLLHEATFDDGLEGDARAKRHCTIGEALGVAKAMKAKNVILTHFSQRYQKLPTLKDVKNPGQMTFEEGDDATDPAGPLEDAEASNMNEDSTIATDGQTQNGDSAMQPYVPPAFKRESSLQKVAEQMSICIAFDLMRVTIPQIKDMYKYYPAIESMFEHEQAKSDAIRGARAQEMQAVSDARDKKALDKRLAAEGKKKEKNKNRATQDGSNTNGKVSRASSRDGGHAVG